MCWVSFSEQTTSSFQNLPRADAGTEAASNKSVPNNAYLHVTPNTMSTDSKQRTFGAIKVSWWVGVGGERCVRVTDHPPSLHRSSILISGSSHLHDFTRPAAVFLGHTFSGFV